MSSVVAELGKLMVLETALSVYFWKAACILTWSSGRMSDAILKTSLAHWGTSAFWIDPVRATCSMSWSE